MKKTLFGAMFVLLMLLSACGSTGNAGEGSAEVAADSDFPSKPIELIVPFDAGNTVDAMARTFERIIGEYLPNGQEVVVVNKPGGSQTVGLTELANSKADGYKIGMSTTSGIAFQPHFGSAGYTPDGFKPILRITSFPQVLVVTKDAPWDTFDELVEWAKENPDQLKYGTAGVGNSQHLMMEEINQVKEIKTTNVPFGSSAETITAVLGGHADAGVVQLTDARQYIESGDIKVLVNVGETKTDLIEDVPMLPEKGVDVGMDGWVTLLAPKGIPDEHFQILHDAFKQALEDPEFVELLETQGSEVSYANSEDMQQQINDVYETSGEMLKRLGLVD